MVVGCFICFDAREAILASIAKSRQILANAHAFALDDGVRGTTVHRHVLVLLVAVGPFTMREPALVFSTSAAAIGCYETHGFLDLALHGVRAFEDRLLSLSAILRQVGYIWQQRHLASLRRCIRALIDLVSTDHWMAVFRKIKAYSMTRDACVLRLVLSASLHRW